MNKKIVKEDKTSINIQFIIPKYHQLLSIGMIRNEKKKSKSPSNLVYSCNDNTAFIWDKSLNNAI